ncbi:MAG: response regulator [Phycisphaerales bacterium]|nr:MAG: response regulator [Phycisphaerales bacterium]
MVPPQTVCTVLIVEDSPEVAELLEMFLEELPYVRTVTAPDGQQAIEQVRRSAPDLILLDVMMPKMSGFEVCRQIKHDPRTHDIPVIVVTALDMDADYERARECGADDFIRKPINRVELIMRIESLLELRRLRKQLHDLPYTDDGGDRAGQQPPPRP